MPGFELFVPAPIDTMADERNYVGQFIGEIYFLNGILGAGGFGLVYSAIDREEKQYAVKVGSGDFAKLSLKTEAKIYSAIQEAQTDSTRVIGFPHMYMFREADDRSCLVMDRLGCSLADIIRQRGAFNLSDTCYIGIELLDRLERIHNIGIIHGDLKPDNILTPCGAGCNMYLCDFGGAVTFRSTDGEHVARIEGSAFQGTLPFSAISTMKGIQQSRSSEMESLGYVLVYLATNTLPWLLEQSYVSCLARKRETTVEELCMGLPDCFYRYMVEASRIGFADRPNYDALREIFKSGRIESSPPGSG